MGTRHADFAKIRLAFLAHHCKDPALGESRYAEWLKASDLDETQSYYLQGAARAAGVKQSFEWAKFLLQFVKEDTDANYYKVEALFPVESMNVDCPPFTRDEVLQAARSLTGKPSDLNHDHKKMLEGVTIEAAQYEGDTVECLVRVPKTSPLVGMIERKEIVNVSIEGEWSHGIPGQGLVLTGLGWLTKDTCLPGIPLTRIMPVELIAESFNVKEPVKEDLTVVCAVDGSPADFLVSICNKCLENAKGAAPSMTAGGITSESNIFNEGNKIGIEILEEKQIVELAEKIALKLGEKTSELEQLKNEVTETKAKLLTAQENAKVADGETKLAQSDALAANEKLAAANKVVEAFKVAVPGVDIVASIPKLMPVSEHIAVLEKLVPSAMVERSSMGMQHEVQLIRSELFKAQEKLKAN